MTRTPHTRVLDALPMDRFVSMSSLSWRCRMRPERVRPVLRTLVSLRLVQWCRLSRVDDGEGLRIYRRVAV